MIRLLFLLLLCEAIGAPAWAAVPRQRITICCSRQNDLFVLLQAGGYNLNLCKTVAAAIAEAPAGSAVLLLADNYPSNTVAVSPEDLSKAAVKNLRIYLEFPSQVPGITFEAARKTTWERLVINSHEFDSGLPKMQLLMANECYILPTVATNALVVAARVAGYNSAIYGLPASTQPVLFSLEGGRVLVATTKLSGFVTGRFAPTHAWSELWTRLLSCLLEAEVPVLQTEPLVRAAYARDEKLPRNVESRAFRAAAQWIPESQTLLSAERFHALEELFKKNVETTEPPAKGYEPGDGRFGILEGYASTIRHNGSQPQRSVIRADCQAESAMVLALDGVVNRRRMSGQIASNLLDFVYFTSDMCQGDRGNPKHPAFGLISWGGIAPAWLVANYGDDSARVMLGTILASTCLKSDRWDEPLLRALFANLRLTGKRGFQGDRIDMPELGRLGWEYFHERDIINYSPHFESYIWACYLWAYRSTGETEFLDRAKSGIRILMEAFPDKWRWNDTTERARMLLCLAWLVRVEDTAEHQRWLRLLVDDILITQHETGALPDRFRGAEGSHYQIPKSNEAYGTGETPLLQANGDPVTDQLYHSGFVLLGLHEAAAALRDPGIRAAEDKLVNYLCRIQTRSKKLPYLSGTWFRAFDFELWEPWASSGDAGWGAWSLETGWAQAWTAGVMGLRLNHTTFWDFSGRKDLRAKVAVVRAQMSHNSREPATVKAP
jgi:hypothetical protein